MWAFTSDMVAKGAEVPVRRDKGMLVGGIVWEKFEVKGQPPEVSRSTTAVSRP